MSVRRHFSDLEKLFTGLSLSDWTLGQWENILGPRKQNGVIPGLG
jgi:hypothetical protein